MSESFEKPEQVDPVAESFFSYALKNEGQSPLDKQEITADLKKQRDDIIERSVKDGVMSAREVLLEQNRTRTILQKKFELLKQPEALRKYCEKLKLDDGMLSDLQSALPIIIVELNNLKFQSDLSFEDREEYLDAYIRGNIRMSLRATLHENKASTVVNEIVGREIDSALILLSQIRKRPTLAHRVRGFGQTEASREALANALEQQVAEIEFDIRMSQDSIPMIHHNATLGALAGRNEAIHDLSEGDLRELTLTSGEHLASLRDLFEMIKQQNNQVTKLNIDIKDFDESMLDNISKLVKEYGFEHRVVIVSWFPQALQYLYEKDPTLSYSLSYFPKIRGLSRWIIEKVERVPKGKRLFGYIATWFAKQRADNLSKPQGTLSEVISETIVISAEQHWKDLEQGQGIGKHPLGYAETEELTGEKEGAIMARVLRNGSVNIAAMEEILAPVFFKLPLPKSIQKYFLNLLGRSLSVQKLATDLARNGIKVNLFDLKSDQALDSHFESLENADVKPGVVYSSNPDVIKKLVRT